MKRKGPWSAKQAEQFMADVRVPLRLACNGNARHPLLASLWFLPADGRLWCATQCSADVVTLLRRDPHCAYEISVEAPPYRGVRGRGITKLHDDRGEPVLRSLLERYLGGSDSSLARTLLAQVETETAIEIEPLTCVSWDYEERMREAV